MTIRKAVGALATLSMALTLMGGCPPGPVNNLGPNEFCEQTSNCAAGLTCDPNLNNVCFFGDCTDTLHSSACCAPEFLVAGNCCAPPRTIQQIIGGGEVCAGSPAGAPNGTTGP
jgi:hypothetical protein